MAIIQGSLTYSGDSAGFPFKEIVLEFALPRFSYVRDDKSVRRIELQPTVKTVFHSLRNTNYEISYPTDFAIGNDLRTFWDWAKTVLVPPFSLDEFKLKVLYSFLSPDKINIGQGEIAAFFLFDEMLAAATFNPEIGIKTAMTHNPSSDPDLDSYLPKSLFVINADAFYSLLAETRSDICTNTNISNELILLALIREIGQYIANRTLVSSLTDQERDYIVAKWKKFGVEFSRKTITTISNQFDELTSFPLVIESLSEIKLAGSFQVMTSQSSNSHSDLAYYRIAAEARIRTRADSTRYHTWSVVWDNIDSDPTVGPSTFTLTAEHPIFTSSIEGPILVRVIGFDGTTLWRHAYPADSEDLENIQITIDSYLPGRLEGRRPEGQETLRRIRGQVLAMVRSQSVRGLTVVLQAKEREDSLWRIVSACETGNSGHFSLKYPKGKFIAAQALVSVSPNSTVDLDIVESGVADETISDSFLYLLLNSETLPDDTTCKSGSVSRLPDNADLIDSDEYSQDLGGRCVNVTTPNRTLREYSYNAIVRVSDPDVANYTLTRTPKGDTPYGSLLGYAAIAATYGLAGYGLLGGTSKPTEPLKYEYKLTGGTKKIERAPIDLSNPVRWQDAPEASNNLSFYQSVTVATGHILFFKAVFKADGYSLGDLVYSLPLAPGQKKQIVSYDVANTLEASEAQRLTQGERLAAELVDERIITDELGGGISESLGGRSSASTAGISAGLGLGVSMGQFGGSLGVAGGYSNAGSSASQSGARNISQFFAEKLRQALMQKAESYRELNASVVTTVKEGQEYAVTTEVVANHNHCHSVTMMFFEVLRHYAITQELADVQECVFVPLLLTEFTQENISKWKDILATNLLPIPSNTYLQPPWFVKYVRRHPLIKAFDANERIKTEYTRVDFPEGSYAEDEITSISGEISLRIRLPRPKTRYDRILSLPIIKETRTHEEIDIEKTTKANVAGWLAAPFTFGASLAATGTHTRSVEEEIIVKAEIFDQFMTLDANFQTVPPSQAIRIKTFAPVSVTVDGDTKTVDFFQNPIDKEQWKAYADILDFSDVCDMLDNFFADRLISEWDRIFYQEIAPLVFDKIVDSIKIEAPTGQDAPNLDLTRMSRYTGGEQSMRIRVAGSYSGTRTELSTSTMRLHSNSRTIHQLRSFVTLIVEKVRIQYATAHFNGYIYNGYVGDDLLDEDFATSGATLSTPLTARDKRNPRTEDKYIVEELMEHLNSNLEHYNKVLWRNLDPDRRYMLLDGFSIEIFDRAGISLGSRSLASVVKNDLITIVGNSLVFPVADGYNVSRTHIVENSEEDEQPSLLDHYRPIREVEPYRLSVPTRGVYMESVMGQCDACESVKEDSSQDWDRFRTEEPTAISPVVTPTPTRTDWRAIWAQFAQPLVALQISREAPAPGAGLQGLSEALANAEAFRDVTGLAGNQENAIRTYLSNQENARAFAEMAKTMAMQEHNSENSRSIMQSLDSARERGAISDGDYSELVRDHLGQQIDGGERRRAEERRESSREPSLTNAAIDAVNQGQSVRAERTDSDGTRESVTVTERQREDSGVRIVHPINPIHQPQSMACWAAAATMMMNWKNGRSSSIEEVLRIAGSSLTPPNENYYVDMFTANTGLAESEKEQFILSLGMVGEAPASYPLTEYVYWLQNYGPLWITTDDDSGSGFSPHARILFGIEGDIVNNPNSVTFTFVDPADGQEVSETFEEFIEYYEQMVTDIPSSSPLFTQIVRFRDQIRQTEGLASQRIRVRNRFNTSDNQIGDFVVSIINETRSRDFSLSGSTAHSIDIADFDNGTYVMIVLPADTVESPIDWPSIGVNASGTSTPNRVWQEIRAEIRIENHRIVSSSNSFITISGRTVNVNLRPIWSASPNKSPRLSGSVPNLIVIHHTAGTNPLPPDFMINGGYSAHYVIPRDGNIIKLVHESESAHHAGNSSWKGHDSVNSFSIGIEIVHHPSDGAYTEIQYYLVIRLLKQLLAAYPSIPSHGIVGHSDIATCVPYTPPSTPPRGACSSPTNIRRLGRKGGDPGLEFNWPLLEDSDIGLIPANESDVFSDSRDSTSIYGDVFSSDQALSLPLPPGDQPANYADVIREVNSDLSSIGYLVSVSPDTYDIVTEQAVRMFKEHFFTGIRRQSEGFYSTRFDFETAKMLKRVVAAFP